MFARITPGRTDLATIGQLRQLTEDRLIPAFQQMPGLVHYLALFDDQTGQTLSITVWETREQAMSPPARLGDVREAYEALGLEFGPTQTFEVAAQA
jgi:hypothetical protein